MNVLLNRKVTSFSPKDDGSGKIGTVVLENVQTGETEEHHPAGVFVFIGLDPNTGFLERHGRPGRRGGSSRPTTTFMTYVARRVRGRRRARRVHEAARQRRRRGRGGRDPDPRLPRPAAATRPSRRGLSMDPKEIFELIIKADEKLKYATEANAGAAASQARDPVGAGA